MNTTTLTQNQRTINHPFFKIDKNLNQAPKIHCIATACQNQCVKAVVDKGKLGRTRS